MNPTIALEAKVVCAEPFDQPYSAEFGDLELLSRPQQPPSEEVIHYLNELAKQPPFCWTNRHKDHLPRL